MKTKAAHHSEGRVSPCPDVILALSQKEHLEYCVRK